MAHPPPFSSSNSFRGPSLAFVPNSITASPTKERGPEFRERSIRWVMQFSERDHGVPRAGGTARPNEKSRVLASRSSISSPPFPSLSPRYLWYTPLTRLTSTRGERNSDTRNAFVERVFSISLNECVASLFLLSFPLSLSCPATIYPLKEIPLHFSLPVFELLLAVKGTSVVWREVADNFLKTRDRGTSES